MFVVSYIFILVAAVFCALMDIVENENFFESIFKNKNQNFWYKRVSWNHAKKIFGYKFDAWHISKSLMIICFASAIIFYKPFIHIVDFFYYRYCLESNI
jgi:hypothetical protein